MCSSEGDPVVYAFDTLGYSKRLRDSGIPQPEAEAHAEAARDFIMAELVTKTDLHSALEASSAHSDAKLEKLEMKLATLETKLDTKLQTFETKLDTLSLRLAVRLGAMLVVAVGVLATALKLVS